jgi:hypothetical protein
MTEDIRGVSQFSSGNYFYFNTTVTSRACLAANHIAPSRIFFVFSCTLYFVCTCFCVSIILHFAFLSLLTTHNTNIRVPGGFFCSLFALYPYFFVLIVLAFAFYPYNTHNTNIHVPRRDSNPQFQQASGHRLTAKTARPSVSAGNRTCNLSSCSAVTRDCATVYPLNPDIFFVFFYPAFTTLMSLSRLIAEVTWSHTRTHLSR